MKTRSFGWPGWISTGLWITQNSFLWCKILRRLGCTREGTATWKALLSFTKQLLQTGNTVEWVRLSARRRPAALTECCLESWLLHFGSSLPLMDLGRQLTKSKHLRPCTHMQGPALCVGPGFGLPQPLGICEENQHTLSVPSLLLLLCHLPSCSIPMDEDQDGIN